MAIYTSVHAPFDSQMVLSARNYGACCTIEITDTKTNHHHGDVSLHTGSTVLAEKLAKAVEAVMAEHTAEQARLYAIQCEAEREVENV
jgi:diphthamide synthase subunit DPH2